MERLTSNKDTSEMNMVELAHNGCYVDKNKEARYRDYDLDIDARDFVRKVGTQFGIFEKGCAELIDEDSFDETMLDLLQCGYDTKEGLLALFYRNLWAMADLRERLKHYEDLKEQDLLPRYPLKGYDPNIRWGNHTVKITIQRWEYVGHIIQKKRGNCKGRDILKFDFEEYENEENDCDLQFDEDLEYFRAKLMDKDGGFLEVEGFAEEFNKMIVAVEIIDFKPESQEEEK